MGYFFNKEDEDALKTELLINESLNTRKIQDYLAREMAHLLKYDILVNIREENISRWANSIFQSIYDINSVDIPSYHELEDESIKLSVINGAFDNALILIKKDKNNMTLFPSQLPPHYTYEFLKDFDSVRNYMIGSANNNVKIINAINSKCEENKKKKIKR